MFYDLNGTNIVGVYNGSFHYIAYSQRSMCVLWIEGLNKWLANQCMNE